MISSKSRVNHSKTEDTEDVKPHQAPLVKTSPTQLSANRKSKSGKSPISVSMYATHIKKKGNFFGWNWARGTAGAFPCPGEGVRGRRGSDDRTRRALQLKLDLMSLKHPPFGSPCSQIAWAVAVVAEGISMASGPVIDLLFPTHLRTVTRGNKLQKYDWSRLKKWQ